MSRVNPWIRGAFVLTIAGIITKLLSALYRVPFQNMVGDHGFYIYQQVYPFYGVIIAFMTYGFPMAISKHYVEKDRTKNEHLASLFIGLVIIGLSGFVLFFFGSSYIAQWMKDESLAPLFRTLSYLFILFPFISFQRGLFQGAGNMTPTAVSQVGEQFVRVLTILAAAYFFTKANMDLYDIGNAAVFGSITGGMMAVVILASLTPWGRFKVWRSFTLNWREMKSFMILGIVFSMNSLLFIFLQLADSLQLYQLLLADGYDPFRAKVLKGIYDRGQPLIQLGVVLATSFSLALVPGLARLQVKQKESQIKNYVKLSLKIGIIIGLAATVGYALIMESLNKMLFQSTEGTAVLTVISLSVILGSVIMTGFAVMQGLGFYRPLVFIHAATFLGKIGLNFLLIPFLGTMGAAISTVLILLILVIWMVKWLAYNGLLGGISRSFFIKVGIAILVMAGIVVFLFGVTDSLFVEKSRTQATLQTLMATMAGGIVYLWMIIKVKVFRPSEWKEIPFGKYVNRLFT